MKKIILSAAMAVATLSFAQKKEVQEAYKAAEAGNVAEANRQIAAADRLLNGQLYQLEPAVQEQYYYAKGMALLKSGKAVEGSEYLAKINDLGKSKIYTGKNGKTKVYYVGKAAADQSGVANLKEETYQPTTVAKLSAALNPMVQKASADAMAAYEAKNYATAAAKFAELNNLLKAAGQPDQLYEYYSAISYALAEDTEAAIAAYNALINSGYTGVRTTYTATDKSGQVQSFDRASWELMKKTSKDYTDFKSETAPSVEKELYETNAALMVDAGKYDDAIALIDKGLAKFPGNAKLTELKGLAYFKSGNDDKFMESLKQAVAKNPQDALSWYNLGVLQSKNPKTLNEAEASFNRALEIDPNNVQALQAMFFNVYMGDDGAVIAEYDKARKAGKMDEANKILADRKARFTKGLPYLERWYKLQPDDRELISTLRSVYQTLGKTDKVNEMKSAEVRLK